MSAVFARIALVIRREHWWAEAWSAIGLIWWGMQNAVSGSQPSDMPNYHLVATLLCDWQLEAYAMLVGITQITGLMMERPWARCTAGFLACFTYTLFVLSDVTADTVPIGFPFVATWIGVNIFAIARSAKGLP